MKYIILLCLLTTTFYANAQKLYVPTGAVDTSTNNSVGINTKSPAYGLLQINGNGAEEGINLWTNSGEITSRIWINNSLDLLHISRSSDPIKGITINKFGFVGIGTSNIDARLKIQHNGTLGGNFKSAASYLTLTDGNISMLMDNNEIYTSVKLIMN